MPVKYLVDVGAVASEFLRQPHHGFLLCFKFVLDELANKDSRHVEKNCV